jgi:DNA mismatch repair protein MutS
MPANFERRQTLVNNERFVSMELKSYEQKIFSAEEKIHEIERRIFSDLLNAITLEIEKVLSVSKTLATLDVLLAFAKAAKMYRFTRPLVDESSNLHIQVGRHPVIENSLIEESFIPNDTELNSKRHLLLITGPNMAGKSTYIRQVAILTIMAQIGSFIPAKKAHLGVVDKVFSRIGASDDLSRGQSTFMIEMTETANILRNSTERSLVILDEIGRGTSTFDGISIAWAVAEHLLKVGAKTLFATHYWELTELEKDHEGAANVHVAVQEAADQIVFLRKIVEGSTDKSYGIHVARLAGLPQTVLKRAHSVLFKLEEKELDTQSAVKQEQLSFFTPPSPKDEALEELGKEIESIDVNQMTPMDALLTIQKWKDDLS